MADVDKLSDAELRTKLMEYGFPSLPITNTTRKVMVKKLKLLMDNKNKAASNVDGRRSLGRYSSEDDSDTDVKNTKNKRRVTMAAPPMQPPAVKPTLKKTTRIVETTIEEDIPKRETRGNTSLSSATTRSSRIVRKAQDEFDTGSESESEILRNSNKLSSPEMESKIGKQYRYSSSFNTPSSGGLGESPKKSVDSSYSRTFSSSSEKPAAFSSPFMADSANDRLNHIRSRLSLGTGADRPTAYQPSSGASSAISSVGKEETPFLSNFTRRLSQLSSTKTNDYSYRSDAIKEHDTNGASAYPRTTQYTSVRSTIRPRDYQYDYKANRVDGNLLKDNLVPFTVLGVAVLFFIFVGFIYLGMRSDTSLEPTGYKVPLCETNNINHVRGVNCVLEGDVVNAIALLKPLKIELKKRGVEKVCENTKISDRMTDDDVLAYVKGTIGFMNESRILTDLRNLQVLILKNPSWGISIVHAKPDEEITEKNILHNLDKLGFERVTNPVSLTILKKDIPWSCSIANKFFLATKTILIVASLFGLVYASRIGYKQYSDYQKQQRNEVICLVEKILDVLQSGAGNENENNYVVINHVRDMIIPVTERRAKDKIWKQAVEFINDNESRVRTEIQVVQGEEYFVWRWVGSSNLSMNSTKNKSWQGQAFETQTGAVNSLPCSPTPCLKIRGMVEDGDRNTQVIREAVLSKCAAKCRILHCAVDTNMKCVYLKCVDTGDAAVAYQNLHGWWYAGQLVTVKYVRLERYMQRFPDSPVAGPLYLKATFPQTDGWAS